MTELSACQWSLRQNTSSITCIYRGPVSSIPAWLRVFNCVLLVWGSQGRLTHTPLSSQALIQLLLCQTPLSWRCSPKNLHFSTDPRGGTTSHPKPWFSSASWVKGNPHPNPIWFILLSLRCLSPSGGINTHIYRWRKQIQAVIPWVLHNYTEFTINNRFCTRINTKDKIFPKWFLRSEQMLHSWQSSMFLRVPTTGSHWQNHPKCPLYVLLPAV